MTTATALPREVPSAGLEAHVAGGKKKRERATLPTQPLKTNWWVALMFSGCRITGPDRVAKTGT
jgi:hypothetical protein